MRKLLTTLLFTVLFLSALGQTTWQVCVEDPPSSTCPGKTGTFTPGNLIIQQGDMIQFTTTMVLLGGYTGTLHDIQFSGSPANNVTLLISSDIFNQVTTVTTPPFNTPGVFPMECVDFNHCILSEYPCTGYSVTVLPACSVTASFTASATTVCEGDIVNFTNASTGASNYTWKLDEFVYATSTNSVLSFGASGSYDIELIADDGAGCMDSVTVTINVDPASNAGADNSQTFCNLNDSIDMNTLLTGNLGGTWNETSSSNQFNVTTGYFNYQGLPQQNYFFEYVVSGIGVCPNDTAEFIITVNQEPNLNLNISSSNVATSDSVYIDFTTSGVLPGAQYLWNFCDGNLATDTLPFYYSWASPGNQCVCVSVNNGNNCSETICDSSIVVDDDSGLSNQFAPSKNLEIYPNPVSTVLHVNLSPFQGEFELLISDIAGTIVFSKKVSAGTIHLVSTENYAPGTYFISLISAKEIAKAQFIIE